MLKNRTVIPAPGGPFDPDALRERGPDEVEPVPDGSEGDHDGPRAAGDDAPEREADEGMSRIEDAAADDADADDDGVADPPTGDDPGPAPDSDDPMGGAAPSG